MCYNFIHTSREKLYGTRKKIKSKNMNKEILYYKQCNNF